MKKLTILFTSIVLCMVFVMQPTHCYADAYIFGDHLNSTYYLLRTDDYLTSPNKKYKLVLQQTDGNLVLYHMDNNKQGRAIWSSNTADKGAWRCDMQWDGNLVIYSHSHEPLWSSMTFNNPGAYLVLQDDGNLVIYKDKKAIWATNTCGK